MSQSSETNSISDDEDCEISCKYSVRPLVLHVKESVIRSIRFEARAEPVQHHR